MARNRIKYKGRTLGYSFVALPHELLDHVNFTDLKPRAMKLFLDLAAQYKGSNNGDLAMPWSRMENRGWNSRDQLSKARRELLSKGWIIVTRQGGKRIPTLFAITLWTIDDCGGKLDVKSTRTPLGYWKQGYNPTENIVTLAAGQTNPL